MTTKMTKDPGQTMEQAANVIKTLRDEIQVKIHLGTMDARDAWEALKPDLEEVEKSLRAAAQPKDTSPGRITRDEARLQLHLAAAELKERWGRISPKLSPIVAHLGNATNFVAEAIETAVEEGADADPVRAARTKERQARAKESLKRAGAEARAAADDAIGQIKIAADTFRDRVRARRAASASSADATIH